jgi:hypothetical protein
MIDHILKFETEAAAKAALPQFVGDEGQWDGSRTIPNVSVITADEETLPGWWIAIGLTALSEELRSLPDDACRLITDRYAAEAGQPFVLYLSHSVDPGLIATARVSPVFAGSRYPMMGNSD